MAEPGGVMYDGRTGLQFLPIEASIAQSKLALGHKIHKARCIGALRDDVALAASGKIYQRWSNIMSR